MQNFYQLLAHFFIVLSINIFFMQKFNDRATVVEFVDIEPAIVEI